MNIDDRITTLAQNLLNYSLDVKPKEVVYIDIIGHDARELGQELIRICTKMGAIPYWQSFDDSYSKPFFNQANPVQHQIFSLFHQEIMQKVDCYIGIRSPSNPYALSDLTHEAGELKRRYFWQEVHGNIRQEKRWVVLRYPNEAMSMLAQKSKEVFEDFYFQVCNLDYSKMSRAMDPLVNLMEKTDKVRIVSPGTDITFSIKDISVKKCDGKLNIPDGEVFTAPVRDSINGSISYNASTFYDGSRFENISLSVKEGKIIKADCQGNSEKLNKILNTDDNARYFGEFAIGVNPHIKHPMNDILFDEKIAGSIHLTPGSSYDVASNGNKSSVHWDLVLIQRSSYGGGDLYFDDQLIRKDGLFVVDDLQDLNPEALI